MENKAGTTELEQKNADLENELQELFAERSLARLDRDAAGSGAQIHAVLAAVAQGETDILVGTQMLTKGHDFDRVTLVGILNADQGLFGTGFRGEERLAQAIVQVAGRAGRAEGVFEQPAVVQPALEGLVFADDRDVLKADNQQIDQREDGDEQQDEDGGPD